MVCSHLGGQGRIVMAGEVTVGQTQATSLHQGYCLLKLLEPDALLS